MDLCVDFFLPGRGPGGSCDPSFYVTGVFGGRNVVRLLEVSAAPERASLQGTIYTDYLRQNGGIHSNICRQVVRKG